MLSYAALQKPTGVPGFERQSFPFCMEAGVILDRLVLFLPLVLILLC